MLRNRSDQLLMKSRLTIPSYLVLLTLVPSSVLAHEMWVLTKDVVGDWSNKPLPETYTSLTLPTVLTIVIALLINGLLFKLNQQGANELFPLFRAKMRGMRPYSAVVLRACLSWVLMSSALAVEPRFGNEVWSHPTLLAPDILISELPLGWQWLRWAQVSIAISLIIGLYVRGAAIACLMLVGFALYLTGMAAVAYAPVYAGVALYLFFAGGGSYFVPMPVPSFIRRFCLKLVENASISRAQFLLRVLAGCNFLFLAIYFKVMQPNLMLAIIDVHDLPILGLRPDVFVLIIAAVEVSIGLLVIFGVLLRFLSVVLIGAFIFFAICLSDAETLTSHMLYYGVAISFLFNGNGQWRKRSATDAAAHIVIVGNSIGSVAAAQYLEKILPHSSNVRVSVLSHRSDIQFTSMLPEVVSGAVQPTTLINPLSKVLERTHLVLGKTQTIDTMDKTLSFSGPGGASRTLSYDQLIVANEPEVDRSSESATDSEGVAHLSSVVDALQLKQQLLGFLIGRSGEWHTSVRPFKVAIYGGGERGSALAMEVHALLEMLKTERGIARSASVNVVILEHEEERRNMSETILRLRAKHFSKRKIKVVDAKRVATLCSDSLRLLNGKAIAMDVVINLQTRDVLPTFKDASNMPHEIRNSNLSFALSEKVWLASYSETLRKNPQRRLSLQLEQARLAAFNAWASSQSLKTKNLKTIKKSLYECYMGRYSVATWRGVALPSALGWLLNRHRYISTLPSLERKLRVVIDWALDVVFNNDTVGLLEYDYQLSVKQGLRKVPGTSSRNIDVVSSAAPDEYKPINRAA